MHLDGFHIELDCLAHPLDVLIRAGQSRLSLLHLGISLPLEILGQVVLHQDGLIVAVKDGDERDHGQQLILPFHHFNINLYN